MASQDFRRDEALLAHLLVPSYLSATLSILLVVIVGGATLYSKLAASHGWLADTVQTVSASNHHLLQLHTGDGGDKLSLALLFCFWACVGLCVYYVVVALAKGIAEVSEVGHELEYVNTNRRTLLLRVLERLIVRVLGVAGVFFSVALLIKVALPSFIASIQAASLDLTAVASVGLEVVIVLGVAHLLTVMIRLVVLRPRLFGSALEVGL